MKVFDKIGLAVPKIILPKREVDLEKWAVIACDQFTSNPEYWRQVDQLVGDQPSTLRLIYPEVYLEEPDKEARIVRINETMKKYLNEGILTEELEGFVYVERTLKSGLVRRGLVVALDLEKYDFHPGAKTLIRATERTIESRIPPRVAIRQNAIIELPHIMVLIDDKNPFSIFPLIKSQENLLYDFDLMMNGGHIKGYKVDDEKEIERIVKSLENLLNQNDFLYAVGDGNHSLATAKAIYETNPNELNRYALVELINLHDKSLEFEPIHRVVFDAPDELLDLIKGSASSIRTTIKVVHNGQVEDFNLKDMGSNLAVGNLQALLDQFPELRVDYIHGEKTIKDLAIGKNIGFILPAMAKDQLFFTVAHDGALPRKTFSMGQAEEKRYYLETRQIRL